jgi:hypothetical protein
MQKHLGNINLTVGSRVQMSSLGIERCPRLKRRNGVIVRVNPIGTSYRVLLDGRKSTITLHQSYVEPEYSN